MKKAFLIIFAVAVLGVLGAYGKSPSGSASSGSGNPAPATQAAPSSQSTTSSAKYKDGTFTGTSEDTPYGIVQIAAVISGGNITDINFLQMPSDMGHSQEVTAYAEPLLKQQALQKQSARIDFVSGATSTSYGYQLSLQSALDKAQNGQSMPMMNSGTTNTGTSTPMQSSPFSGGNYDE